MSSLVIKNANILTMDSNKTQIKNGFIAVENDIITQIEEGEPTGDFKETIDAKGGILFPGFVNTHCHASMIPFRSMGDDCADRLRRFLFPLENDAMNKRLVYLSAKYAICEMLLSGTTTFCDMYYFEEEVAKAAEEMGIRGYLGETIIGQATCVGEQPYNAFEYQKEFLAKYKNNPRIKPIIAPHGTTTCDEQALIRAHKIAVENDILFTVHTSEMDYEMKHFSDLGTTPTKFLDDIGVLDEHCLLAHCIHSNYDDILLMKKRNSAMAHCILSNTKAGKGVAPVKAAIENGVAVGLGTDGPASGNTLSMFEQMKAFACAHKTKHKDRSLFSAYDILKVATLGGAKALKADNEYGTLAVGMQADFVVVETNSVNMFPVYNPYSALVYSANSFNVDTVVAAGKVLVKDKKLTGCNLEELKQQLLLEMTAFLQSAEKYSDFI